MISYHLGIDIGGSYLRGVLWNGKRALKSARLKTPRGKKDFEAVLARLADRLGRGRKISGIGIGAAGIVGGTKIISSPNIPYLKNFDFRRLFPRALVRLDNDARGFARAEMALGAGRGRRSGFVFTIGTGVGRAYWERGSIKRIKKFEKPEAWERAYQKVRGTKNLASFLAPRLAAIIRAHRPAVVIIGGGAASKNGFMKELKKGFYLAGVHTPVLKAKIQLGGAIGAALLAT